MSNPETATIDLSELSPLLRAKLEAGEFGSLREVIREGLDALEREEAALDAELRAKIEASLNDPRPSIPAEEVFRDLRAHHAARVKARGA